MEEVIVHIVGEATLTGGLAVRAISLEPIVTRSTEIGLTRKITRDLYREALAVLNASDEPVYLNV